MCKVEVVNRLNSESRICVASIVADFTSVGEGALGKQLSHRSLVDTEEGAEDRIKITKLSHPATGTTNSITDGVNRPIYVELTGFSFLG